MKTLALVAALMIGTAAVAQDAPSQPTPDTGMQSAQPMNTPPANEPAMPPANTGASAPADASTTSGQPMNPPADAGAMSSGQPMTPPADSSAGSGMAGGNMSNATGMQNMSPPPSSYPLCSKTVKDRCRNRGGK